jgi:hypothetical protein
MMLLCCKKNSVIINIDFTSPLPTSIRLCSTPSSRKGSAGSRDARNVVLLSRRVELEGNSVRLENDQTRVNSNCRVVTRWARELVSSSCI